MDPKRLLQVVASSRGGGAVHTLALTAELAAAGHEVTVAMPTDGGHLAAADFEAAGARFVGLPGGKRSLTGRVRDLGAVIRQVRPELVHAHGSRAAVWARCALLFRRLPATRFVYSVHGFATPHYPQPRRLVQGLMMRWVSAGAEAVIACCESERAELVAAGIAPARRIAAISCGFELRPFLQLDHSARQRAREALDIPDGAWLLLMVCRLDRPRDFKTLFESFRRVVENRPGALLFIVGDGPERTALEEQVRQCALSGQVRMWGFRRDVASFCAAADALVLTSWGWEGLPVSVIEAQAAGLPAVVTDAGGAKEAISPEVSGILVPRRDSAALAAALLRLARDPELAAGMGANARRHAQERFGSAQTAGRMEGLYATLIDA